MGLRRGGARGRAGRGGGSGLVRAAVLGRAHGPLAKSSGSGSPGGGGGAAVLGAVLCRGPLDKPELEP